MLLKSMIIAGAAVLATAGVASASLVLESWDEANAGALTAGSTSKRNDALGALGLSSLDGYVGSQVRLTRDASVTYTFIGYEASNRNGFAAGSGAFDSTSFSRNVFDANGQASFTQQASAGLLDFSFLTDGRKSIINGDGGVRGPDFFASVVGDPTALSGNSLLLFLDDSGAGSDDDYDDMVVRLDISDLAAIPLPAAAGLTGSALVALLLLGRRRRS